MQEHEKTLSEIKQRIANGDNDLVLEATIAPECTVSIERAHRPASLGEEEGYVVTLAFPAYSDSQGQAVKARLVADLADLEGNGQVIQFDDVVQALGLNQHAPIWMVQAAP